MKIMITTIGDINVVRLSGSMDSEASALVHQALQPIAKTGGKILIDMEKVEYASSAHFHMLAQLYKSLKQSGGKLATFHVLGEIKEVFSIMGFSQIVPQFDSEEDAIAAMSMTDL